MRASVARLALACALMALAACSGGGGSGGTAAPVTAPAVEVALSANDVRRVIAQAVAEAQARNLRAHVAVVDRVGNVLATFAMQGAPATVAISSGLASAPAALEGVAAGVIPAPLAAISKALTGAYLSSRGNAFSTRTAGQIVQEHFNPQEAGQPSGPLYGVQFSQLPCSDVNRGIAAGTLGPKRSPLGLSGDPGGLPLYKDGVLVGGVGIEADGRYGLDRDVIDIDQDGEEIVAVAASTGFAAPAEIRGERITADGRTFRFVDSEAISTDPARAPAFDALPGALRLVEGYSTAEVRGGTAYGTAASGIVPAASGEGAWILVDAAGANRYPARDASEGSLRATESAAILSQAFAVAQRARAQIRRPLGSAAQVTIAVVDTRGDILGLVRSPDAPVFGIDVAVQKARSAMFFSHPEAFAELAAAPPAVYLGGAQASLARYPQAVRAFLGDGAALTGATAWSARAIGNIHRPFFPDGIDGAEPGPLSTRSGEWSPFNVGFQLDLVFNQVVKSVLGDGSEGCAGRLPAGTVTVAPDPGIARLRNGAQVFPGGIPIYRGTQLVGGVGVSGDGVDQDDMIAFLGLANAGRALPGVGNAPAAMRADRLAPRGVRLRYAQCPQAPFNGSTEQGACDGL